MVSNLNKDLDSPFFAKEWEEAISIQIEDLIESHKGAFVPLPLRKIGNPFQVRYEKVAKTICKSRLREIRY